MPRCIQKLVKFDESDRKFVLEKGAKFENRLLPVIQNALAMGLTEADIGMLVGYNGKNPEDWLNNLRKTNPEVKLAAETGVKIANTMLVAQMFRSAIGYEYEETVDEYTVRLDEEGKEVVQKKATKVMHKHQPGNAGLAQFLSENRMPDLFKRRVDVVNHQLNYNIDVEATAEQIATLAGSIVKFAEDRKKVVCEVVEPVESAS